MLAAAKELFLTKGYATTTIGQIAASAGVLKAVFDVSVAGDDETDPMVEREDIKPIMLMVRDATAADPGAAEVWRQPDLPAGHVRDLLWTLNSVEVFELLVLARGWPPERYAEFVADTLINALIPDR